MLFTVDLAQCAELSSTKAYLQGHFATTITTTATTTITTATTISLLAERDIAKYVASLMASPYLWGVFADLNSSVWVSGLLASNRCENANCHATIFICIAYVQGRG